MNTCYEQNLISGNLKTKMTDFNTLIWKVDWCILLGKTNANVYFQRISIFKFNIEFYTPAEQAPLH